MSEYSGALTFVEIRSTLWLIPALPLLAALLLLLGGRWLDPQARDGPGGVERSRRRLRMVSVAGHAGAGLAVVAHAADLFGQPMERRFFVGPSFQLARLGSLDFSPGLALDASAAVVGIVVASVALAAACLPLASEPGAGTRHQLSLAALGSAAALAVPLAADLFATLIAWELLGLVAWLASDPAAAPSGSRRAPLRRGASALLVAGAAVSFWALAGSWVAEQEFAPDFRPPMVAVERAADAARPLGDLPRDAGARRDARLTMTAYPGAWVRLGGADLCETDARGERGGLGTLTQPCSRRARTPFVRLPVPSARHDVTVVAGGGLELLIERARVPPGVETVLAPAGATGSFREVSDALRLRAPEGSTEPRHALGTKKLLGFGAAGVAGVLLVAAALWRALGDAAGAGRARGPASLVLGCAAACVAPVLLVRAEPLVAGSAAASGTAALGGTALAAFATLRAGTARDAREVVAWLAGAQAGLALAATACGLGWCGIGFAAGGAAALGVLGVALAALAHPGDAPADLARLAGTGSTAPWLARGAALGVLAIAAGPVPGLHAFWLQAALVPGVLATDALPGGQQSALAFATAALLAVAAAGNAWAAWRLWYLLFTGTPSAARAAVSRASLRGALGITLLVAALATLAVSDRAWGGGGESPRAALERWITSSGAQAWVPLGRGVETVAAFAAFGMALVAWSRARARHGASRPASWADDERNLPVAALLARLEAGRLAGAAARVLEAAARPVARAEAWIDGLLGVRARDRGGSAP